MFALGTGGRPCIERATACGVELPAMVGDQFQRARHPGLQRMVGRFEAQHQRRAACRRRRRLNATSAASSRRQLLGFRPDCDSARTHRTAAAHAGESHRRRGAKARPVLQPHPGLGDHAQRAFGADHQAVGRGAGARAGQAARLDRAGRRDRARALDEIVDVRVLRGVVAAGAGRDPAAQRRELEALRESAAASARAGATEPRAPGRARRPGCAPSGSPGRPPAPGPGVPCRARQSPRSCRRRPARRRRRRWCRRRTERRRRCGRPPSRARRRFRLRCPETPPSPADAARPAATCAGTSAKLLP